MGLAHTVFFFTKRHFGIIYDLLKSWKDSTESFHIDLTQFPIINILRFCGTFVKTEKLTYVGITELQTVFRFHQFFQ